MRWIRRTGEFRLSCNTSTVARQWNRLSTVGTQAQKRNCQEWKGSRKGESKIGRRSKKRGWPSGQPKNCFSLVTLCYLSNGYRIAIMRRNVAYREDIMVSVRRE